MRPEYFEGTLQLRNVTDEARAFVYSQIEKRPQVTIAKVEPQKNGEDIYLSSQHYLQTLGKLLAEKFGGHLKITARLHTKSRIKSKDVYRVTVLFRMVDFKKGDIITHRGDSFEVLHMGKKVFCKEVATHKKITFDYADLV